MPRTFMIDSDRTPMLSTAVVTPVPLWIELADKTRKIDPNGRQAIDEQGRPLWSVEVISPAAEDDARDRTEVIAVEIASHERPDVGTFGTQLRFDGLRMSAPYVKRGTGQLAPGRWYADGIRKGHARPQPQAA